MKRRTPNHTDLHETITSSRRGYGPDDVLWCMHCKRTFFGRDARPGPYFGRESCGHDDCNAAGFGIDIFDVDGARALNDDSSDPVGVRDAILGIDCGDEVHRVTHFKRLDLEGLAALLARRLIDPDASQNDAPATMECLAFLGHWPEVRVHGYAVHPDREDDGGDVMIEGFECSLDDVAEDLRAPLRAAFRQFAHADGFIDDGEQLYAWWD
jgi:hypothetical protein